MYAKTLCIHYNKDKQLLTYNAHPLGHLAEFDLIFRPDAPVTTVFRCYGAYPATQVFDDDAPSIFSNSHYPLRLYVKDKAEDCLITLLGRPLSDITAVDLHFCSIEKPIVRLSFRSRPLQDVIDTLVSLGVEVIIDNA